MLYAKFHAHIVTTIVVTCYHVGEEWDFCFCALFLIRLTHYTVKSHGEEYSYAQQSAFYLISTLALSVFVPLDMTRDTMWQL